MENLNCTQYQKVCSNVKAAVTGNKLIIEVDLTQEQGTSYSGKSTIVATTHGNQSLQDLCGGPKDIQIGLNIYKYNSLRRR